MEQSASHLTSAAKADAETGKGIAAVNRCATQNQLPHRFFCNLLDRGAVCTQGAFELPQKKLHVVFGGQGAHHADAEDFAG